MELRHIEPGALELRRKERGALELRTGEERLLRPCKLEVGTIEDRIIKINMTNIGILQARTRQIAPREGQSGDPPLRIGRALVFLDDMRELCVVDQIFPM